MIKLEDKVKRRQKGPSAAASALLLVAAAVVLIVQTPRVALWQPRVHGSILGQLLG